MTNPIQLATLVTLLLSANSTAQKFDTNEILKGKRIVGIVPIFSGATTRTAPDGGTVAADVSDNCYLSLKDANGKAIIDRLPLSVLTRLLEKGNATPLMLENVAWNQSYVEVKDTFTPGEYILFSIIYLS